MSRWARYSLAPFLSFLLVLASFVVSAQQQKVSLSASRGTHTSTDWLVHSNSFFVAPGQPGSSVITIDPRYRDASLNEQQYTGRLSLSASCCLIPYARGWVGPGVTVSVGPQPPTFLDLGRETPAWLRERLGTNRLTLSSSFVDIAGQPTSVTLNATAGPLSDLVPGNFLVEIGVEDTTQDIESSISVMINVLPPWPPDGPAPACTPSLEVLPLSSLPGPDSRFANVYAWKAGNPTSTSFTFGAKEQQERRGAAGLEVTVRDEGLSPPLPTTMAVVRFTNTEGSPVGIRSSDSRNCAVPGRQWEAHVGNAPTTFTMTTADTTTLVFSRSVCRGSFIFCWGGTDLEDVFAFSEGAFWTLFGGRAVDIESRGKWDQSGPFLGVIKTP
jgi:hypothetical protein